jgi:16S rRNA (cytidine1402-2'-O)-methyltransferase
MLRVCATPIGNLGDVTLRVLDALREAQVVLAEDTRVTRKLLARYDISTPLERYDDATVSRKTPQVVERLLGGATIALVSDAGTPGISDPGSVLVDAALEAGVPVEVLPGASAILTALVASGLPTHAFYFGGFLPRKAGDRTRLLDSLSRLDATLVFYESPRRTVASLRALADAFPARRGAMARELTKLHEEVVSGKLPEIASELAAREEIKGEVVLLVGPPAKNERALAEKPGDEMIQTLVDELVASGVKRTEAVKRVAKHFGVARGEVYDAAAKDATSRRTTRGAVRSEN